MMPRYLHPAYAGKLVNPPTASVCSLTEAYHERVDNMP